MITPGKKSGAHGVTPINKKQISLSIQPEQDNGISKHEDLSALGRRQLPPQGLHSTASASSPCLAAKMPCSRRRCCLRKNVSSQVMRSSSASTLARRSGRPRSCASTPSRSCFNAAVGDATDSVSDCEVGTREPAQEDAAAAATEGVEDWAESEQKGLFGHATGSRCPCLLPCQCVRVRARARVCVRVFSSGLFLYFKSFKSSKGKPSRNHGRDSSFSFFLVFSFPFLSL